MPATYDPSKIVISVLGTLISAQSFGPGTFVSVKRNKPQKELTVGAGGEDTWTNILDKSGEFEFTILQTSLDNDILSSMLAQDEADNSKIGPITMADLLGNSIVGGIGRLVQYPDVVYAAGQEARKWKAICGQLGMFVGGNP